jgi:hypothetical protein
MDNEIPVKYITDYKILPSGEKEIVTHLIPGMENENENISIEKYLHVANYGIVNVLTESKAILDNQTPPKDNLQDYEFNIFRILENLDNVLQFIKTDADFKKTNGDSKTNALLKEITKEITKMESLLKKTASIKRDKEGERVIKSVYAKKSENTINLRDSILGKIDLKKGDTAQLAGGGKRKNKTKPMECFK